MHFSMPLCLQEAKCRFMQVVLSQGSSRLSGHVPLCDRGSLPQAALSALPQALLLLPGAAAAVRLNRSSLGCFRRPHLHARAATGEGGLSSSPAHVHSTAIANTRCAKLLAVASFHWHGCSGRRLPAHRREVQQRPSKTARHSSSCASAAFE